MSIDLVATASITIEAPRAVVWRALVDPHAVAAYMVGTAVTSDWQEGSPITWEGEGQGRPYRDHGVIERFDPPRQLVYTRFSPRSGLEDIPGNHHLVTITLADAEAATHLSLTQDRNTTEAERADTERNWEATLAAMQRYLET